MDIRRRPRCRLAIPALALSVSLFGSPLPAIAEHITPSPPPSSTPLAKSVEKIVATTPLEVTKTPVTSAQPAPPPKDVDLGSPSFFKTPAGIIVIGVFAVGTAYALYSMSNDRVRGAGR